MTGLGLATLSPNTMDATPRLRPAPMDTYAVGDSPSVAPGTAGNPSTGGFDPLHPIRRVQPPLAFFVYVSGRLSDSDGSLVVHVGVG